MSRTKQGTLPGTTPDAIPAIDAAADDYFSVMNKRCRLSKKETEAQQNLLEKMIEHKQERYVTVDGLVCTRNQKTKVKVKRIKDEATAEESNGEAEE